MMRTTITRNLFDAVLFDLDGVITDTANLHAVSWKQMFDEYLTKRAADKKEAFFPFDLARDYQLYVDESPDSTGFETFSYRAISSSPKGIQKIRRRPKLSVV